MNAQSNEKALRRLALAIGVWKHEGGAPGAGKIDHPHEKERIELPSFVLEHARAVCRS